MFHSGSFEIDEEKKLQREERVKSNTGLNKCLTEKRDDSNIPPNLKANKKDRRPNERMGEPQTGNRAKKCTEGRGSKCSPSQYFTVESKRSEVGPRGNRETAGCRDAFEPTNRPILRSRYACEGTNGTDEKGAATKKRVVEVLGSRERTLAGGVLREFPTGSWGPAEAGIRSEATMNQTPSTFGETKRRGAKHGNVQKTLELEKETGKMALEQGQGRELNAFAEHQRPKKTKKKKKNRGTQKRT